MNITQAVTSYLDDIGNKRANPTRLTYKNGVNVLLEHLKSRKIDLSSPIETLSIENVINFPAYLGKFNYSKKTIGSYTSGVKGFVDWMVISGFINPTPQEWLRLQKSFKDARRVRESRLPRHPKNDDVQKMKDAVRCMIFPAKFEKERNIAIVEFLASTGCRNDEIRKLLIKNVDTVTRSAIVIGKGNKERVVFFSKDALDALTGYWKLRGNTEPSAPVFSRHDRGAGKKTKSITTTTIRNVVKEIKDVAGIEKFTPHYFRHAFAIRVLRETHDLALVQDLMGHSDPSATRVYAKISEEDLRNAHRKVFG